MKTDSNAQAEQTKVTDNIAINRHTLGMAKAFYELFSLTKDTLSIKKLEWLTGLTEHAQTEIYNISETLSSLAEILASKDEINLPSNEQFAFILYGLSDQIRNINAAIEISVDAQYLINKQKEKQPI
jgi:hypothetical protein